MPCISVEKLHKFLPECEKAPGSSKQLQVTKWMESIYGKENHDAFNSRMGENNPPPSKKVPKTAPVASRSSYNVKSQPQTQKRGKGNTLARATESQIFSMMPWKICFKSP
ncbi:hypothetical protein O181_029036 [Austropuccinia psidii MF-1]|uniref:Uncharacterized protein n=1 Tax=Austropuccinia psidii MF-1 TaxID=1389203 RepID=A0A9Q3CVP7_9BASI|nr:hypothetical protein [Austropuccinia psidii MF-1]